MSEEYFFGVTLDSASKEFKWEPDELKENGSADASLRSKGEHCLVLRQALLVGGKDGDVNTVEIETQGYKGTIKIPVVSLVAGKQSHFPLDLNLPDPPVVLRLIEGSGPVHVVGNHVIQTEQFNDDDDDDEDDEMGMEEFEEEDEEDNEAEAAAEANAKETKGKKRANSGGQSQPGKRKKEVKGDA